MFEWLLSAGSDPKLQPEALGFAAWEGRLDFVKQLLQHGASTTVRAYRGCSALANAQKRKHISIVKILQDQ